MQVGAAWERRLGLPVSRVVGTASPWLRPQGLRAKAGEFLYGKAKLQMPAVLFGAFCINNFTQDYLGTQKDFFYGSFVTDKDPEAIAELYQAEDLLKIIAIHPFMFSLFMDQVKVGESPESEEEMLLDMEESHMIVQNLGMDVAFVISEEEEEIDGVMVKTSFKRWERFVDYIPFIEDSKTMLWDQTWTFGFRRLPDGRTEVYHEGHDFQGPWPVRIIIHLHQKFVLWACQNYVNSKAFGSEEDDAMEEREAHLQPSLVGAGVKLLTWLGADTLGSVGKFLTSTSAGIRWDTM
jgi:hypothetical protein